MTSITKTTQTAEEHEVVEVERFYMPQLSAFKSCTLLLGLLVGIFIYLSTLGAEFVAVMVWGKDILDKTTTDLLVFSLIWNLFTTLLALIVLSSLRTMVLAVLTSAMTTTTTSQQRRSQDNIQEVGAELLSYLEGRFAVGALVGICVSWNATNLALGMRPQVIQSCIIMAVACLWCRLTLVLMGQPQHALIYDHEDEEQEDTTAGVVVIAATATKCQDNDDDLKEPLLQLV